MTGKKRHDRCEQTKELLSENVENAIRQVDALTTFHPDEDMAFVMNHVDRDKLEEFGEELRKRECKSYNEMIAALVESGMTEDDAIHQLAVQNGQVTHQDKRGNFVTKKNVPLLEFKIRVRDSELQSSRRASYEEMLQAMQEFCGGPMSKTKQMVFHNIYTESYTKAWVTVHNWVFAEYTADDTEPIQPFKHRVFMALDANIQKWAKENELTELLCSELRLYASIGFDRGFADIYAIAAKSFGLPDEPKRETALEYMRKLFTKDKDHGN